MKLVSIVMCCYNAEEFITETVDSILAQTYGSFEFLIGDDCSTDRTLELLESYQDNRLKVFKNIENLGPFKTANNLIKRARGDLIARIDSDDVAHPERIALQVKALTEQSDIECIGSNITLVDVDGQKITDWQYPELDTSIRWKLMFNSAIAHPASMFFKTAFEGVNGYNETLQAGGDYDFWFRLSKNCKLGNVQKNLLKYRIHNNSISSNKAELQRTQRTRISREAVFEYCGFEPTFNFAFIETVSFSEITKLQCELVKVSTALLRNFPDDRAERFIAEDIQSILATEISKLSYIDRVKSVIATQIMLSPRQRLSLVIPKKIKQLITREERVY